VRALVLGGTGMLGHQMVRRLATLVPDTWWTLRDSGNAGVFAAAPWLSGDHAVTNVEASDLSALERRIAELRPDVVVNCLGIVKQRDAAHDPIASITVNSLLPHRVTALIRAWEGRLIHFSTDCVFSGKRGNYTEDDPADPVDLYGRTKHLGECDGPNCLTLRTSIIGRELSHHQSLLDWLIAQEGGTVRGFRRHWWSGVTTNHLADVVADLVVNWPSLSGLYQLSSGRISKYDLLVLLRDGLGLDVEIVPDDEPFCDRSLVGERFAAATGYRCPPWPDLISQLAADSGSYSFP
jgi:dTDP-4-dehydrorhamnose reductase